MQGLLEGIGSSCDYWVWLLRKGGERGLACDVGLFGRGLVRGELLG